MANIIRSTSSITRRVILSAGLTLILLISAGEKTMSQILIGPKAGARLSWMNYEEFDNDLYKKGIDFGYSSGFTVAFQVQKRYFLQLDVMYTQTGKRLTENEGPQFSNDANYHYLNTPIIYKIDFRQSIGKKSFKYYVGAGPNVNFWLGGNGKLSSVELREDAIDQLDYKIKFAKKPSVPENRILYVDEANRVQVGLILSTGMVLEPAQGQSMIIDFRYEWGHSYLARKEASFTNVVGYRDNLVATNQSIYVSVSYVFDIINKGKKEKRMYYEK